MRVTQNRAATNNFLDYLIMSVKVLFASSFDDYLISCLVQKMSENGEKCQCFSEPNMMTSNVKHIQFAVIEE